MDLIILKGFSNLNNSTTVISIWTSQFQLLIPCLCYCTRATLTFRGSQTRNDARKLNIPEMSHMRATLEEKPTPIHTETAAEAAKSRRLMP